MRDSAHFPYEVAKAMFALRGYRHIPAVPADVRNDVFQTMDRHADLYTESFRSGFTAEKTAEIIQNAEWTAAA